MRPFNHLNARSLAEASEALRLPGAVAMAGGGDLLGALKDDIAETYPKLVVNLKTIPGLDGIREESGQLCIGALVTLADLSRSEAVRAFFPALADAAGSCASPALRESGTVAGNLCQLPRCWYFRKLGNRFDCARKGGTRCFAASGDNRYHSVFGPAVFADAEGSKHACLAVCQSELAPVLVCLGAAAVTTARTLPVEDLFDCGVMRATVLEPGELITEIRIPLPKAGTVAAYKRFSFRKSIDFPVLNLAVCRIPGEETRICFGGVAPKPWRPAAAEALLKGQAVTPELADRAGEAALAGAKPAEANAYKLQLMKTLLKRLLLSLPET